MFSESCGCNFDEVPDIADMAMPAFSEDFHRELGALPSLAGDFYREGDDVTRGLSLVDGAADFDQFGGFMNLHGAKPFDKVGYEELGEIKRSLPTETGKVHRCDLTTQRFQEEDEAPPVPDDDFFQLEQTTVVVKAASAMQIGNRTLDFLDAQASSQITKVNRAKYTIKAIISYDGLCFETKVRIYRHGTIIGQYQVEMQRRSGDTLGFHQMFSMASQYFYSSHAARSGSGSFVHGTTGAALLDAPNEVFHSDADSSIDPLLDMAETHGNPQLQAEAVQGLLQAASDVNTILQLCTPRAFIVFRQLLLQLVCFRVAEPLARLLCCLALMPQAAEEFADQQLLEMMIDKVWSSTTGQVASEQLAQAVCHTLSQRAGIISPQAKFHLTFALNQKLNTTPSKSLIDVSSPQYAATVRYLEESVEMLSSFRVEQACR